jgi:hypothetical protein
MPRAICSTWKQEIVRSKIRLAHPTLDGLPSLLGDLELNGTMRFLLYDDGASCDAITMANVPGAKTNEVASA